MNVLAKGKRERQALEVGPVFAAIRTETTKAGRKQTRITSHRHTGETQSQATLQKNHSEKAKTPL